jgi:DNA polymerase-1
VVKRTKTGFSTNEEVLRILSLQHALPAKLLKYRELMKLKSTYIDTLPKLLNEETNRIHTSFNQAVAATGRLSSSEPNLQNIPVDAKMRRAFVPRSTYLFLSSDYSQIELRILAHITEDQSLIRSFLEEEDIHQITAAQIFEVHPDDVTPLMRRSAKVVNFGIIYGMSPYGLGKELGILPKEAKGIIEKYFKEHPCVREYIKRVVKFAREQGYVTTLWGRRRYLPNINSKNASLRELAERMAINTPIQGSAADLIKLAMINIHHALKEFKSKMILQVHDELLFEVPESEVEEMSKLVKEKMEGVATLRVPIKVRIQIGSNWGEIH